jgi:DNA-binding beta-propeller fold protein YncE
MKDQLYTYYDNHRKWQAFYKELLEDNDATQITVTNCTSDERVITLWGTNKCAKITESNGGIEVTKMEADVGQISYEVVYNPVNDLFYVINNRTDTITVINDQAVVVGTVQLRSDPLTFFKPTNIVVNTNPNSTEYGFVAITGTTLPEFITVDLNFEIARRIALSNPPIDLAYNPVNDSYYISERISDSVIRISTASNVPTVEFAKAGIKYLGINTDNGDIYAHIEVNDGNDVFSNDIDVYNISGIRKGIIQLTTFEEDDLAFYYNSINQKMYISYLQLNTVIVIDGNTLGLDQRLNIPNPVDIEFSPIDGYVYVAHGLREVTRINENLEIVDTLQVTGFDRSFAISSKNGYLGFNNSTSKKLFIVRIEDKLFVKVSDNYEAIRQEFKHNPMIIAHMKVVATTDQRINTLQIIETSISGKQMCEPISLRGYQSPQGFGNVSEVFEMEGQIVDGRVCWRFKINPNQQVTFLIYYKQLEMYNFLPEKSRVSTGVQQSKGIPLSWLQED